MRNSKYQFFIDGRRVTDPTDSQDIQILSTFANDGVQDNVSTSELTFALDSKELIDDWVRRGTQGGVGIFEGIPFDIRVENGTDNDLVGEFLIDFSTYTVEENRTTVSFDYRDGLQRLNDRLEAISFGWLEETGVITSADYETITYVVEPTNKIEKIASLLIMNYLTVKAIQDAIVQTKNAIATISALFATGFTGGVAAAIYAVAQAIVTVAYTAALLVAFTTIFRQLLDTLIPIPRRLNAMTFRTMLERVCDYLGLELDTNIDLDTYLHIPSTSVLEDRNLLTGILQNGRRNQSGIPNVSDFSYSITQFLDLLKRMFLAKYAILDGRLVFRNKYDEFWVRNSEFRLRTDTFNPSYRYNNNDLKGRKIYSFATDINDEYTITDFTGTNYEIITRPIRVNNQDNVTLKGIDNIQFPVALGKLKNRLGAFDVILKGVAKVIDGLINTFGGNSNYTGRLDSALRIMKVSQYDFTTAKVMRYENGSVSGSLTAKFLYENFHIEDSFTQKGQKILYENIRIPFNFENWIQLSNNSYFIDDEGREGKVDRLEWSVLSDYATIDYSIREKYTDNLEEEFVEG